MRMRGKIGGGKITITETPKPAPVAEPLNKYSVWRDGMPNVAKTVFCDRPFDAAAHFATLELRGERVELGSFVERYIMVKDEAGKEFAFLARIKPRLTIEAC